MFIKLTSIFSLVWRATLICSHKDWKNGSSGVARSRVIDLSWPEILIAGMRIFARCSLFKKSSGLSNTFWIDLMRPPTTLSAIFQIYNKLHSENRTQIFPQGWTRSCIVYTLTFSGTLNDLEQFPFSWNYQFITLIFSVTNQKHCNF